MNIQVLQFDERVGLGTFSSWLTGMDCNLKIWRADMHQMPPVGQKDPVVLLGGYMGVNDRDRLEYLQAAADWVAGEVCLGRPLLAICLGAQLLAHALGAKVHRQARQEKGICKIYLPEAGVIDPLFDELPNPFVSFEWHNDSFDLPEGSLHLAQTATCSGQAFRYQNAWGVQFHPEVDERIVADWCQRTGSGIEPLEIFRKNIDRYLCHSKRLLENFILTSRTLL